MRCDEKHAMKKFEMPKDKVLKFPLMIENGEMYYVDVVLSVSRYDLNQSVGVILYCESDETPCGIDEFDRLTINFYSSCDDIVFLNGCDLQFVKKFVDDNKLGVMLRDGTYPMYRLDLERLSQLDATPEFDEYMAYMEEQAC